MTFYEKYPKFQNPAYLKKMLVNTVYATMALEDQEVPKSKVEEIITKLLKQQGLEKGQLRSDKAS